jgi:hypothetical protein
LSLSIALHDWLKTLPLTVNLFSPPAVFGEAQEWHENQTRPEQAPGAIVPQ